MKGIGTCEWGSGGRLVNPLLPSMIRQSEMGQDSASNSTRHLLQSVAQALTPLSVRYIGSAGFTGGGSRTFRNAKAAEQAIQARTPVRALSFSATSVADTKTGKAFFAFPALFFLLSFLLLCPVGSRQAPWAGASSSGWKFSTSSMIVCTISSSLMRRTTSPLR